jgi:predicted nucleic acid-binding protein
MYLDTAILVKLFVPEADSEFYGKLADGQPVSSSYLAYTEVWSACMAKERYGAISSSQRQRAWESFSRNVEEELIFLAPLSEATFRKANWIIDRCNPAVGLRSLDALHLATVDQLQDWPLCTNDNRMRQAAKILGFPLTPSSV